MKLIQSLLCLLVVSSCFMEIQGNLIQNQKAKHSIKSQGIIDKMFGDWNNAKVTVSSQKKKSFTFDCKVRSTYFDAKFTQPYGIQFDGLNHLSTNDKSGFIQNVLSLTNIVNQDQQSTTIPILDFRLITGCNIHDNRNGGWFDDWKLIFDVVALESYNLQSSQPFGNLWTVSIKLPGANKDQTMNLQDDLREQCKSRNEQMNGLKKSATYSGIKYYELYSAFVQRQVSLSQKEKLGQKQEQLVTKVRNDALTKQAQIKQQLTTNQQALQQALSSLKETQQESENAKSDIEVQSQKLQKVKQDLSVLQQSQTQLKAEIIIAEGELNEAQEHKEKTEEKATSLVSDKKELEANLQSEQAEIQRAVAEAQARMDKMQQEFQIQVNEMMAATQKEIEGKVKVVKETESQISTNDKKSQDNKDKLQDQTLSIKSMVKEMELREKQSNKIDEQIKNIQANVETMSNALNKKRTVKDQLAQQITIEAEQTKSEEENLKKNKEFNKKVLADLAQKEKEQLDLQDQNNAEVIALQAAAKKASEVVGKAYDTFTDNVDAIKLVCWAGQVRLNRAVQKVTINQQSASAEIADVTSNSKSSIARQVQRMKQVQTQEGNLSKLEEEIKENQCTTAECLPQPKTTEKKKKNKKNKKAKRHQ